MGEVLEWFQCRACGRRYRWNADIAGTQVRCQCGESVQCPELRAFTPAQDLDNTMVETVDSPTALSPAESMLGYNPIAEMPDGEDPEQTVRIRHKGTGIFGLTTQGRLVLWFVISMIGVAMVIHAVITTWTVYIVISAIIAPIAFFNLWRVQRRWRRGRPLMRSIRQMLEEMSD